MKRLFSLPLAFLVCMVCTPAALAEMRLSDASGSEAPDAYADPAADNDTYDPFGDDEYDAPVGISDPLQKLNRAVFYFNDKAYFYALKPAARAYSTVVPEGARKSVQKFFLNTRTPIRLINCLLQGNVRGVGTELSRFVINTTIGIGGFFDPAAARFSMNSTLAGFDQTLSNYGVGTGIYIVLPFFGASSARGTTGLVADLCMNPLTYVDIKTWERLSIAAYDFLNETSLQIGAYEDLKKVSIDPYLALRDAYVQLLQRRP